MIGSIRKWWSLAALVFLSISPCAFASSALPVPGAGDKMEGCCVGSYHASKHGSVSTPVVCDDLANETYSIRARNYTSDAFSSLGSALSGQKQNGALNGLNSLGMDNWLGMMPSDLTASRSSNRVILTPQACPIGLNSCRVSVPEGGTDAMYLLMVALSCFAAILFRRRGKTVAAR